MEAIESTFEFGIGVHERASDEKAEGREEALPLYEQSVGDKSGS